MSSWNDLDPHAEQVSYEDSVRNSPPPETPGPWHDPFKGIADNIWRYPAVAALKMARNVNIIAGGFEEKPHDAAFYYDFAKQLDDSAESIKPKPEDVGIATSVIGGLSSLGTEAALGGGIAGVVAHETIGQEHDVTMAGGSTPAVLGTGLVAGAASAAGLKLPASFTGSLAVRALKGAGANVALDVSQRAITKTILEKDNLNHLADQYTVFDPVSMSINAILGGGIAALHKGVTLNPDVRAAAQTLNLENARTEGQLLPEDPFQAQRARDMNESAIDAALAGEPMSVHPDTPVSEVRLTEAADRVRKGLAAQVKEDATLPPRSELDALLNHGETRDVVPVDGSPVAKDDLSAQILRELGTAKDNPSAMDVFRQSEKAKERAQETSKATPEAAPAAPISSKWPTDIPTTVYRGFGRADRLDPNVYSSGSHGIPIAGEARYYTLSKEAASRYGPKQEAVHAPLSDPLVIRSDDQWRTLTKEAGWEFPNPHGLPPERLQEMTSQLQALVKQKGHDGLIVNWKDVPQYDEYRHGKETFGKKTLENVFREPQVIVFGDKTKPAAQAETAKPAEQSKAEVKPPPEPPEIGQLRALAESHPDLEIDTGQGKVPIAQAVEHLMQDHLDTVNDSQMFAAAADCILQGGTLDG
jgi:hypothetical protein